MEVLCNLLKTFPHFSFELMKLMLLNIHVIINSPLSTSQCIHTMLRETRLTLIGGVHVISLLEEGEISMEALVALNFFPEMNEVINKLVLVYTTGMICLISLVTLLHDEKNHIGML